MLILGRRGFTLLEILLALGLSSLVLLLLTAAIDLHLRVAEKGRFEVEEGQLARTLLHLVANDLRDALPPAASGTGSASTTPAATGSTTSESDASVSQITSSPAESAFASTAPGLCGTCDWLQVDVSRVPRLDQYSDQTTEPLDGSALTDRLSDVKTVAYYRLVPDFGDVHGRHGLVRRELDRAVTLWADQQGQLDRALLETEPIAPEVVGLQFLYCDGTQWLDSWDSQEMGGLPKAVKIGLALAPAGTKTDENLVTWMRTDFDQLVNEGVTPIYWLLVRVPDKKAPGSSTSGQSGTTPSSAEGPP